MFIVFVILVGVIPCSLICGHKVANFKSSIYMRKQEDNRYLHEIISKSLLYLIERILKTERNIFEKCIILVNDESTATSSNIYEIQRRLMIPVIVMVISDTETKQLSSEFGNERGYSKILQSGINQNCNTNIIWVKYKNTAEKLARLIINSDKLAIRRSFLKFIFIPKIPEDVSKFQSVTQDNIYGTRKEITKVSNILRKYSNIHNSDADISCLQDPDFMNQVDENDLTSVLCIQDMDSIPDAVVIRKKSLISSSDFILELLTNNFGDRWPNITLKMLCTWNGTNFSPIDCKPFPDKIPNMQGRRLRISTFSWYFPYISMKYMDGTENKLIRELSNRLNFTYTFHTNKVWGTFEPNGTGEGIHRDLLIGLSDIGIGGIFLVYQNYLYFDFTMPYLLNGITMLVPRPKPLPLWRSIISPFNTNLWFLVIGCVLAGSLALYTCAIASRELASNSSSNHVYADFIRCLLTIIGQLTQAPANRWPEEASLRHLLTWQFIFFALVMSGYKSSLISSLRYRRYEKTIDNANEFTNVPNLYWTAVDESWPKLVSSFSDSSLQKINMRYKRYPNVEEINKALLKGNLAIAVENLATGGYSGADYIDKDFIASSMWLMSSDLSITMVAMELRKGLPYVEHFNVIIHRLVEAGIIRQWEVLSWLYTAQWRKKLGKITMTKFGWSKHVASEPPISMQASHFLGVFFLLLFGHSFSILVFFIEVRWNNNKTRSRNTSDNNEKE